MCGLGWVGGRGWRVCLLDCVRHLLTFFFQRGRVHRRLVREEIKGTQNVEIRSWYRPSTSGRPFWPELRACKAR